MAARSTQPFILLRSIKWVPRTPGDQVLKDILSLCSGSVGLRQLNPIHKKGPQSFFFIMQKNFSHINLNLTCKRIIHKRELKFRLFLNFSFLSPLPKKHQKMKWEFLRCQVLSAKLQTLLSTKCLRHFHEKKSF